MFSVAAHTQCQLGEGLIWDPASQLMRFVDIHGCKAHAFSLGTEGILTWQANERLGWIIPSRHGWVGGFQSGMARFVFDDNERITITQWLARPFEDRPFMRLNDAKCDAHGHIWAGSLNNDDESQPVGLFYRLGADGKLDVVDQGYCVTNGPAISPDGKTLLHTDSAKRIIYAFDLDAQASVISNKRVWKIIPEADGYPDGMNFDRNGCLWLAHWAGGFVGQYSPDGELLQRFDLPAPNITNVAFGGPNLDRLFATSARVGLSDEALQAHPLSGCVFEIHGHGARGNEANQYGG